MPRSRNTTSDWSAVAPWNCFFLPSKSNSEKSNGFSRNNCSMPCCLASRVIWREISGKQQCPCSIRASMRVVFPVPGPPVMTTSSLFNFFEYYFVQLGHVTSGGANLLKVIRLEKGFGKFLRNNQTSNLAPMGATRRAGWTAGLFVLRKIKRLLQNARRSQTVRSAANKIWNIESEI